LPFKEEYMSTSEVYVFNIPEYNLNDIYDVLPDNVFSTILPGNKIIFKPNWIRESHLIRPNEWEQVITHPTIITAVLKKVLGKLEGLGEISIVDGPETASSFEKILSHYPISLWKKMADEAGITLSIIDLREDEWISDANVVIVRNKLPGDPHGSTEINLLNSESEFFSHSPKNGYFGADSDILETNLAHDGSNNLYRVSRTVLEADVFINIPKLKTHKKAGITCNLKNLVGINTYKNFLPHSMIGTIADGGDQFPRRNSKSIIESSLMPWVHQYILVNPRLSRWFSPLMGLGNRIFGNNAKTIRGGSWYGNDTIWRTIVDLNKILLYANPDGTMRKDEWHYAKKYITVVDGILAGEGNGPKSPDPVKLGYLFCGTNPVATDAVCANFMGFDPLKIPGISKAFLVKKYSLTNFIYSQIVAKIGNKNFKLGTIPPKYIKIFHPHNGWVGHIEIQ
jgi:uncharacterized protein (DUF362 family)